VLCSSQKLSVFVDASSALLQTASKGKTTKKKTKGEEGTFLY